jgi:predicted component of type VI protein secretion system
MVGNLDPERARIVLEGIAKRFPAPIARGEHDQGADHEGGGEALQQAGYRILSDIAKHFTGNVEFKSAADVATFGRLVQQALELSFEWLTKGLEGRRAFDEQIGAAVTMVFGLESNPLKSGKSAEELGEFVLDWSAERSVSSVGSKLESAYRDLHLHQLGLLAGAQEAVDAVLRRRTVEAPQVAADARARGPIASILQLGSGRRHMNPPKRAYPTARSAR